MEDPIWEESPRVPGSSLGGAVLYYTLLFFIVSVVGVILWPVVEEHLS